MHANQIVTALYSDETFNLLFDAHSLRVAVFFDPARAAVSILSV
jgi:hypothetical protein